MMRKKGNKGNANRKLNFEFIPFPLASTFSFSLSPSVYRRRCTNWLIFIFFDVMFFVKWAPHLPIQIRHSDDWTQTNGITPSFFSCRQTLFSDVALVSNNIFFFIQRESVMIHHHRLQRPKYAYIFTVPHQYNIYQTLPGNGVFALVNGENCVEKKKKLGFRMTCARAHRLAQQINEWMCRMDVPNGTAALPQRWQNDEN